MKIPQWLSEDIKNGDYEKLEIVLEIKSFTKYAEEINAKFGGKLKNKIDTAYHKAFLKDIHSGSHSGMPYTFRNDTLPRHMKRLGSSSAELKALMTKEEFINHKKQLLKAEIEVLARQLVTAKKGAIRGIEKGEQYVNGKRGPDGNWIDGGFVLGPKKEWRTIRSGTSYPSIETKRLEEKLKEKVKSLKNFEEEQKQLEISIKKAKILAGVATAAVGAGIGTSAYLKATSRNRAEKERERLKKERGGWNQNQ